MTFWYRIWIVFLVSETKAEFSAYFYFYPYTRCCLRIFSSFRNDKLDNFSMNAVHAEAGNLILQLIRITELVVVCFTVFLIYLLGNALPLTIFLTIGGVIGTIVDFGRAGPLTTDFGGTLGRFGTPGKVEVSGTVGRFGFLPTFGTLGSKRILPELPSLLFSRPVIEPLSVIVSSPSNLLVCSCRAAASN